MRSVRVAARKRRRRVVMVEGVVVFMVAAGVGDQVFEKGARNVERAR